MFDDISEGVILEKLQRAKKRTAMKVNTWPDRHLVGLNGQPVPFHQAQDLAWDSKRRTVALIGGSQLGKTGFAPWWLWREIQTRGSGDYLAVTSSFPLFNKKFLPSMLLVFNDILKVGRYWAGDKVIELADPETGEFKAQRFTDPMWGRIILLSAQSLGGLESATAKAAVLDEAGQDEFPIGAYRAIQRRLALNRGRQLISTTLYNIGWLVSEIVNRAQKDGDVKSISAANGAEIEYTDNAAADIALIQADSIINPQFPKEEYEEAKNTLAPDQFAMFFRGRVSRPRHMIYDCLDEETHFVPRHAIPDEWPHYIGLDFGAVHTIAIYCAEEPSSKRLFFYREYSGANKSAKKHVEDILFGETDRPHCYGGANAEGQWRQEFRDAGLSVQQPKISDVWVGINRCYGAIQRREIVIFDDLDGLKNDLLNYHRRTDNQGNPTDEIASKNIWHFADAFRYVVSSVKRDRKVMVALA